MEFVADLHLHSKYSRAVSQNMVLPVMGTWANKKGIDILSATDFTHPLWFREIRTNLVESSDGLYKVKGQKSPFFILSTEISSIYSQGGKVRRIHNLVFAPNFETAEKINKELVRKGANLMADGRPIIGLSSKNLLELLLSIDKNIFLIPCHAWTPWFSLYGSNSGFDSIEECFGELSEYIYGVETGLSSDPLMNWRIKELENRSILSFSDAHSPVKMAREATVFVSRGPAATSPRLTYQDIFSAIKQDPKGSLKVGYTIEFHPEEGKYHYTGHRNCKVVQTPKGSLKDGTICPVCHRPLTVGVMHRVEQLAQQTQNSKVKTQNDENGVSWIRNGERPPFVKLVPLIEILAESLSSTVSSQKVLDIFDNMCQTFGCEIDLLLKTKIADIEKAFGPKIAEGVSKVRASDIEVSPGFDGEYGKVKIWPASPDEQASRGGKEEDKEQLGLF